ncbi:hypothetical protein QYE76_047883 [Lolium multiflorum]|uniref:RING-type E3 ubiquitin transferase BRCA1 n=1 Tax=Lolium multiflorum TaxID=4521 RepID=A0AAD8TPL8_LOLMU|nr:hypothetical protein QYE76_047883 [Lolium multiflorum]
MASSMRRFLNPLVLNIQKMELELTCPVCLKLLSAPTMLPCSHTSCSTCATTQAMDGYSCAICKIPYQSQDLRPAYNLEAIVKIHRSLSSTLSSMVAQQGTQGDIPVASQPTPEPGNKSSYNSVASKLLYSQSAGPANAIVGGQKAMGPALENQANGVAVQPTVLVHKGPCRSSQSSDGTRDLDCDSNDLEGELVASRSPPQNESKRVPDVTDDHTREPKRLKSTDQSEKQRTMTDSWKCEFCHSPEISKCAGPLLHYLNGEPVKDDQAWKSNVLHVHEKCTEWAPQAFFDGDIVKNLENELARSSKIKCSVCGLKGAALGCLVRSCRQSFHFPCAHGIPGCRWDEEKFVMLCPSHSSKKLPCEKPKSKKKAQLQQSSSDAILGDLNSPFPMERNELWTASPFLANEWVICGSALSGRDKEVLGQFQAQTGITVTNNWTPNVTHVVANTDENGACGRTLKVLLAILAGKWVLNVNWLKACLEAREPVPEEPYEISSDVHGSVDGPRTGRLRAIQKAPRLFSGLAFYFIGDVLPMFMADLENLIAMAGGSILDKADLSSTSLILYNMEVPPGDDQANIELVMEKRRAEAEELAATVGCRALAHTWVLDSIAFCKVEFPM